MIVHAVRSEAGRHPCRSATNTDKFLNGDKPADYRVERSMNIEWVFNLKTAKQIGVTVSPWVLM